MRLTVNSNYRADYITVQQLHLSPTFHIVYVVLPLYPTSGSNGSRSLPDRYGTQLGVAA